jgi:hypothetical protein
MNYITISIIKGKRNQRFFQKVLCIFKCLGKNTLDLAIIQQEVFQRPVKKQTNKKMKALL